MKFHSLCSLSDNDFKKFSILGKKIGEHQIVFKVIILPCQTCWSLLAFSCMFFNLLRYLFTKLKKFKIIINPG